MNVTPKISIYGNKDIEVIAIIQSTLQSSPTHSITLEELVTEDIAELIFAGGTMGTPKVIQVFHRMSARNTHNFDR